MEILYIFEKYMKINLPCQAFLVAQTVKNPPAMRETWVQSLGWEDPLEEDLATHSSILAGESPGQSSLVGYYRVGKSQT